MKIGLVSLGCPKNLVDSEVMLGLALNAGHQLTSDAAQADVLVVNTCAFIDSAKQESVDTILEMVQHKKGGTCQRLIVTGCLAERYRAELRAEIPEIDAVLGTGEVPEIVKAIGSETAQHGATPLIFYRADSHGVFQSSLGSTSSTALEPHLQRIGVKAAPCAQGASAPEAAVEHAPARQRALVGASNVLDDGSASLLAAGAAVRPSYIYDADTPRLLATPRHYAYVKIAEGCNYTCAFCIIPQLRGRYRSRPAESIVREAHALAARGVKELLLISQDTTFYGVDRHERGALARLLRELNAIDGLEWIRLLYLYPTTIDDDTLAAMAECDKVCKYIDLPLQHASNPVLKRMRRPGTRQKYDQLLGRIRDRVPGVALRTTFIVGFPGESAADVDELCRFVADHAFDHVGVFTYSHEEGTPAYDLDDEVPATTKAVRRNRVMGLQKRLVQKRQRGRVGQRMRVLIDGPASDHELVLKARLASQAPDIDASVYLTDCDPSRFHGGDFTEVEIVGARGYDLIARPTRSAFERDT